MSKKSYPPEEIAKLRASMGTALRSARKKKNLTQKQVAQQLGIHIEFYSRLELGRALCNVSKLRRLAELLDVSGDDLLFGHRGAPPAPATRADSSQIEYIVDRARDDPELTRLVLGLLKLRKKLGKY